MTQRLRIIFVDDEPSILDGLRRLLRPMRDEWEVFTAEGGLQALALLEREPMDVIVSDMRMPEIDGAQLLEAVRNRHPQMVRIVLSGQSDQESLLRMIGPVHQYLSKPCDLAVLKTAVARSSALRAAINNPAVADFATGLAALPSLPDLYVKVLTCLRSPERTIARLGDIIAQDIGMSARVLQLVNSALYGLNRTVTSPHEAVSLLGIDAVRTLTLAAGVLESSTQAPNGGLEPDAFWRHSLLVAHQAKAIATAERQPQDICNTAFTAGLMHDCGKLVIAHHLPEKYRSLMASDHRSPKTFADDDSRRIGLSHADVGGYLLALWGLPDALIEAVVFHHRPLDCPAVGFTPLTAVHVAECLECPDLLRPSDAPDSAVDRTYLDRLGLSQRIPTWVQIANDLRAKAASP